MKKIPAELDNCFDEEDCDDYNDDDDADDDDADCYCE